MILIQSYRPSNGNIPIDWIEVNITVSNMQELEAKREYWKKWHNEPEIDIKYKML